MLSHLFSPTVLNNPNKIIPDTAFSKSSHVVLLTDQNRFLQYLWTTTDFKVAFHWTYEQFHIYSSAAVMAVGKHPWKGQIFSKEKACCSKQAPNNFYYYYYFYFILFLGRKICIELSHKILANTGPGQAVGTCRKNFFPRQGHWLWMHTGVWERLLQIPVTPSAPSSSSKEEIFVRASVC